MSFKSGDKMYWKGSGKPAYQKIDNEDFGNWRSLERDLDKPLELRHGFRWTDGQVYDYYKNIMTFSHE